MTPLVTCCSLHHDTGRFVGRYVGRSLCCSLAASFIGEMFPDFILTKLKQITSLAPDVTFNVVRILN